MSEYLSLAVSMVALALSIASAIYTWLEHRKAARIRARDEIIDAITAIDKYKTSFWAMSRERDKTGAEKAPYERGVFEQLSSLAENFDALKLHLQRLLVEKPSGMSEKAMRELRSVKQSAESFGDMANMFFDRFKRFNESRIPQLAAQLAEIQEALRARGMG